MSSPASELTPVEFFFDIVSPFGYFASHRIDALAQRYGRRVVWRPILIGVTVLKVMGSRPLLEIPLKGAYTVREAQRYARRYGLELRREVSQPPANPLAVMRPLAWLVDNAPEYARPYAQSAFEAYWREGRDIALPDEVERIGASCCIPTDLLREASTNGGGNLRLQVDQAVARGVFGSPFFLVDGEPFFGVNSMETLEMWLQDGGW